MTAGLTTFWARRCNFLIARERLRRRLGRSYARAGRELKINPAGFHFKNAQPRNSKVRNKPFHRTSRSIDRTVPGCKAL